MESDDEAFDETWDCRPCLRLFEEDEYEIRMDSAPGTDPRIFVVLRFFDTIKGFHKVSVDDRPLFTFGFTGIQQLAGLVGSQRTASTCTFKQSGVIACSCVRSDTRGL
jgi:hypothetical protein